MFVGFWCMFFGHKWSEFRPVNAKFGDLAWTCKRCHKVEYDA